MITFFEDKIVDDLFPFYNCYFHGIYFGMIKFIAGKYYFISGINVVINQDCMKEIYNKMKELNNGN